MISGLVRPTKGKVLVEDMHVERRRLRVLRHVGVVLEGTRTVIWPLTPYENLVYFGRLRGVHGKWVKKRAKELCEFIGLKDKMHTQVRRLSRGQRQRLAICIALIADPSVILLDEPTTGLDVQSSRAIREKVCQMTREMGKSVLLTTHDMHVAQRMCDRIGIIDKGLLVTLKPTAELLEVFTEQTYEFRVDTPPRLDALQDIPGVHGVHAQPPEADGSVTLVAELASDAETRSAALYAVNRVFQANGCLLLSVNQRQQSLENVFVRLTETTI
jgi:ABC-2 type transport system ATP-binding protein